MRNWNRTLLLIPTYHGIWLPDYLWGIETPVVVGMDKDEVPLPDYLWGIETCFWGLLLPHMQASRLPMRNWNSAVLLLCKSSDVFASRLPMRNWNYASWNCHKSPLGFQTTYEELKQAFDNLVDVTGSLPDYLWGIETLKGGKKMWKLPGFQTTYEELKLRGGRWKPPPGNGLPDYLWGIETLGLVWWKGGIAPASRLPMRNWN